MPRDTHICDSCGEVTSKNKVIYGYLLCEDCNKQAKKVLRDFLSRRKFERAIPTN